MLVIALVLTPLMVGTSWMYRASAGAFRFQHDVRVAQNARDAVMKLFLATEADVRGFAATDDPYFALQYREHHRSFTARSSALASSIRNLGIPGGQTLVVLERATYQRWIRSVAIRIIAHPRSQSPHLLRTVDPSYAKVILDDDRQLGVLLDDSSARSESDRQRLLRQILLASVSLVVLIGTIVTALLYMQGRAGRQALVRGALYVEEQRITAMLRLALTPDRLPTIRGITLNAIYVPAGSELQVGGDWYEAFELSDRRVFLMIGDVGAWPRSGRDDESCTAGDSRSSSNGN